MATDTTARISLGGASIALKINGNGIIMNIAPRKQSVDGFISFTLLMI